jgi:hypothetical protein
MDPISLITSAPPEWVPWLIIIAIAFKGWQLWILRDRDRHDDTGAIG